MPPPGLPPPEAPEGRPLPQGAAPVAGGKLFREAAMQAYLRGETAAGPLRVASTSTQALFWVITFAALAALVVIAVARVDLTARGRGILQAEGGSQTLATSSAGRIHEVKVAPGDVVKVGDVLATFDVASLQAALMEADAQLRVAQANLATFDSREGPRREDEAKNLEQRIKLLSRRIASQRQTVHRMDRRRARLQRLAGEGLATAAEQEEADEQGASAGRAMISLEDERMQTRTQLSRLGAEAEAERRRLANEVAASEARRDSVRFSLNETTIRATKAGRIDAVLVQPGEAVTPATPVARVVPQDAPLRVVAFLPERDRAFLVDGAEARLELEQLPVSEFGALRGRVTRIGQELASAPELRLAFGDQAEQSPPVYRVEIELVNDAQRDRLQKHLRPASLVSVRFSLRTRWVITLLFEPIQRLFT